MSEHQNIEGKSSWRDEYLKWICGFANAPGRGPGVREIRIRAGGAYRVFYVAKFEEVIYVLHAFQKKTQKTAKQDIEIGQQRYRSVQQQRQDRKQR